MINLRLFFNLEAAVETNEEDCEPSEEEESKLPLQLAFVGRPNVGKSTLLNAILQEDRVLVGPEAGLTRDSIRVEFEFEGRTIYMVIKFKVINYHHITSTIDCLCISLLLLLQIFGILLFLGGYSRLVEENKVRKRRIIIEHCAIKKKPDEGSCYWFSP